MVDAASTQPLPPDFKAAYPFDSHWLTHPERGHRQHYLDTGSGSPVVMVHGNPTWSYYYRDLIKQLSPAHRCIVPDHLGCGLSDKPQQWSYRLQDHIRNLRRLMDHCELETFDLVVHDWGGPIGLGAALQWPDRIRRIVILNTAAFPSRRIPHRINVCRIPLLGEWLVRGLNGFARPATHMATASGLDSATRKHYLLPYGNWNDRVAISRFVQDIPLAPRHPSYPALAEIEAGLERLQSKPMRILWGARDFCFNMKFFAEWTRRFPRAEATVYDDAGHYVLEDAKPAVLDAIEAFLK